MAELALTRILLVDDTPANLLAMETVLERLENVEFVRAKSGQEALRLYHENPNFAVILLDVMMPVIDGFEVARQVRDAESSGARQVTPIIFLTAAADNVDLLMRGYTLGAVDFLFKPLVPEILRSKVRVFVELDRASKARQHAEEELRKSKEELAQRVEERLTLAAEASGMGLWHFDPPYRPEQRISCNDQCKVQLGLSAGDELSVARLFECIAPEDRQQLEEVLARAIRQNERVDLELRLLQGSGGQQHWVRFLGRAFYNERGEPISIDGVTLDLTDKKAAEQELRAARDAAMDASKAKSTFLANMSHELRTPLNAIIGYSEMMIEEGRLAAQPENTDLAKIAVAGKHLLSLINEILDLSKIEAGRMDLYVRPFDVCSLIHQVTDTARPLVEVNGNEMSVDCDAASVGTMVADDVKVRQILLNLLGNAGKFTKNGRVTLEVTRYCTNKNAADSEWISFRVEDTGIGMNSGELSRLFRDFTQMDASTTRQYGGTGLGLAISRRFARMMGGDISVKSEKGKGAVFTVTIPAQVRGLVHPTGSEETPIRGITHVDLDSFVTGEDPASSSETVLVIDDDATVHDLMRRHLESGGFRVVSAFDGREGVEMAQRIVPRAITLDVTMPRMDGWSVLSELKSNPVTARIPVIIASVIEDQGLAFALGAADYLTKPLDKNRLLESLRRHQIDLRGKHVLVVEDDPATRELVSRTLAATGCDVQFASTGLEALEMLGKAAEPPQLILLDLMMPELDGFEFLRELRARDAWRHVPVVVTTAKQLSNEDRERLRGQVQKIMQKGSYTRDDLVKEVSGALTTQP